VAQSASRQRKTRANGVASRIAILDAAAHIAGERGYEGTSINAVSERSGLPASSIYWHFKNKDELIAAVIDRSYSDWIEALRRLADQDTTLSPVEMYSSGMRQSAEQLIQFPDFLRLGLMLTLERRPSEPTARQRFQATRVETLARLRRYLGRVFESLGEAEIEQLSVLTLAGSDGLFIAAESEGIDIADGFETLARAVMGAAVSFGWVHPNS
jgi:AcrR family transcriptional regulator